MSLYATLFRWSSDPRARGDADAFIHAISDDSDYVFDPDTLPRRVLAGPGEPTVLEARVGAFSHPAVEPFSPEPFLAALVAALEPGLIGPYWPCDLRVDLDDRGRAAWIGVIIADTHRELLSVVGEVAAAHGLSGFDFTTEATVPRCAPKRWLLTSEEARTWDPAWEDIERAFAEVPDGEHYQTLEHPSLALMQYLGARTRLAVEYVRGWGAAPAYAGHGPPAGELSTVVVGYETVRVHASELLGLADARAIFEHYYHHAEPHPGYHWREPGP